MFERVDMIKVVGMYLNVNEEEHCYSVTILIKYLMLFLMWIVYVVKEVSIHFCINDCVAP